MRSSPGDDRLIEGLRRGKPAALAGLHDQYAAGIYNLALRVVRHAPDAEDITQDVLIRAFERLPKDREVMLRPWLYRLTLNRCYDYIRVSAKRPLAAPGHDVVSPHDPYEQSELQGLLEATIGDLTRRQQAALLLKDVHGLSLAEVAACLELTPGSVEVLLARARKAFRTNFEERCVAAGRPLPRSAGGLAALPLLPLPPGLAAPAVPFVPPAPHLPPPVFGPPLTLAAGSGIGAVLGVPASLKTAVLIAAAAATVGTAEIAVTHSGQRPPGCTPSATRVAVAEPSSKTPVVPPGGGALGAGVDARHPVPVALVVPVAPAAAVALTDGGRRAVACGEPARERAAVGDPGPSHGAHAGGDADGGADRVAVALSVAHPVRVALRERLAPAFAFARSLTAGRGVRR